MFAEIDANSAPEGIMSAFLDFERKTLAAAREFLACLLSLRGVFLAKPHASAASNLSFSMNTEVNPLRSEMPENPKAAHTVNKGWGKAGRPMKVIASLAMALAAPLIFLALSVQEQIREEDRIVEADNAALWAEGFFVDEVVPAFPEWRTDYDGKVFSASKVGLTKSGDYAWSISAGQPEAVVGGEPVERLVTVIIKEASPRYQNYIPGWDRGRLYWDQLRGHIFMFHIPIEVDPGTGKIEVLDVREPALRDSKSPQREAIIKKFLAEKLEGGE